MWYWPGDNNCVISEFLRLRTQKGFSAVYSWTIKHPYIRSVVGWFIASVYHHRGIFTSGCTGVYMRRIWGFLLCYIYYILATHLTSSISSLNMSIRKSIHRMPNFLFLSASFDMDSNAARRTSEEWMCVRTYIHMCGCMHTRMHIYVLYIYACVEPLRMDVHAYNTIYIYNVCVHVCPQACMHTYVCVGNTIPGRKTSG